MIKQAKTILRDTFGFDQFRPLQEKVIEDVLNKKDTLVIMPTGGGKSLCYQIPAMIFDGLFFGLVGLSSMNSSNKSQRYGDKWAGTLVMKRNHLNGDVKWGFGKMVFANVIGLAVWIGPMIVFDVHQVLNR